MIQKDSKETIENAWFDYIRASQQRNAAVARLREVYLQIKDEERQQFLDLIRNSLKDIYTWRIALDMVHWLRFDEKQKLFPDLLPLAATLDTKRSVNRAAEIIFTFPQDWLKKQS